MNIQNDDLIAAVLERNTRTMLASVDNPATDVEIPVADYSTLLSRSLVESTQTVFQTMAGIAIKVVTDQSVDNHQHHVSGIISLSGHLKATVVLSMHQDVVFAAADGMLGIKPTTIDGDVIDLVGELSNMVIGNAKERMKKPGISLGLPTVVLGGQHRVAYRSDVSISVLRFESQFGPLVIEFGIA